MKNETRMNCESVRSALPLYVGGEWEADPQGGTRDQVRAHLEGCPACYAEWEQAVGMVRLRQEFWRTLEPAAQAQPDLRSRVMAAIAAERDVPNTSDASAPVLAGPGAVSSVPPARRWAPMAAAAALILAVAGLGSQYWPTQSGQGTSPGTVANHTQPTMVDAPISLQPETGNRELADVPRNTEAPKSGLRRMQPSDSSILEEARPWGLEESPALNMEYRRGAMKMARGQ